MLGGAGFLPSTVAPENGRLEVGRRSVSFWHFFSGAMLVFYGVYTTEDGIVKSSGFCYI